MLNPADPAVSLCVRFLADSLAVRTGAAVTLAATAPIPDTAAVLAEGAVGGRRLMAVVAFIVPPEGESAWDRAKRDLEQRLRDRVEGGYLLWAPQGTELPEREPDSSALILRAEETLRRFVPGGHGEVRFPVTVRLRKSDEQGAYVTARGGLAAQWAQFTNRVTGHFQLDSSDLHRLPAGEGNLTTLIDRIVEAANALDLGRTATIEAEDAWPAQRLSAGEGVAIIGEPPGSELSSGAGLRRPLRRTVQALREPLLSAGAEARVVLFVGPYTSIEQQPVGTALLGFDPALYAGIDLILLAAEGTVKPLLDLTRNPALGRA